MISAIVSVTNNFAIGKAGDLLVQNRADMIRFKKLTTGETIIMGRKTFESFPAGALPNRRNVVLTRDTAWSAKGVEVVHSVEEALKAVTFDNHVWIIGGESIYRAFLPICERVVLTLNHVDVKNADAYFPKLDDSWHEIEHIEGGKTIDGVAFEYITYERV